MTDESSADPPFADEEPEPPAPAPSGDHSPLDRSRSRLDWDTAQALRRFRDGDGLAKNDFCSHYMDPIARWVRTHPYWPVVSRRHEVDDLVNEIWQKVLDRGGWEQFTYRGKGSFEAWLRSVVDNAVKDRSRRDRAQKRDGGDAVGGVGPNDYGAPFSTEPTPSCGAVTSEMLEVAARVLTRDEYVAWYRKDYLGYSHTEVSRLLGRSESGVRGLLHRARRKLREWFGL